MQRVRIGLTGLAFVFLVVMLAMALTREPAGEEPITPNLLDRQQSGQVSPSGSIRICEASKSSGVRNRSWCAS